MDRETPPGSERFETGVESRLGEPPLKSLSRTPHKLLSMQVFCMESHLGINRSPPLRSSPSSRQSSGRQVNSRVWKMWKNPMSVVSAIHFA